MASSKKPTPPKRPASDRPEPIKRSSAKPEPAPKEAPVRLRPYRIFFGLRLFPDTFILVALFLLSLFLLYTSTRTDAEQAPPPEPQATTQTETPKEEPEPEPEVAAAITITSPKKDARFRSGDPIRGEALVNGGAVYYRVVEKGGRILTTGQVMAADPNVKSAFEAKPTFTTSVRDGEIHVYGFSPAVGEAGKVVVPVKFR